MKKRERLRKRDGHEKSWIEKCGKGGGSRKKIGRKGRQKIGGQE